MLAYYTVQPGSWLNHSLVKIKLVSLYIQNKPGFGVGFGGAGRVGTALIMSN